MLLGENYLESHDERRIEEIESGHTYYRQPDCFTRELHRFGHVVASIVNPSARVKSKARDLLDVNHFRAATPLPAKDKNKAKETNRGTADRSKVEKPTPKPQ